MLLAKITFTKKKKSSTDDVEDLAQHYLTTLLRNGQICGEYLYTWASNDLIGFCNLARPNSFLPKHHSEWATRIYSKLLGHLQGKPRWEMVKTTERMQFRSWERAPFLFLFTHLYNDYSAISDGRNGHAIPAYLLPISDFERDDVYCWAQGYADHDRIWLGSDKLEMPAYWELSRPTSQLSKSGRGLCDKIEKATGIPTYYYLMKHFGRRKTEERRRCPSCKGKWLIRKPAVGKEPFYLFHFKCDKCRLVSHFAADC